MPEDIFTAMDVLIENHTHIFSAKPRYIYLAPRLYRQLRDAVRKECPWYSPCEDSPNYESYNGVRILLYEWWQGDICIRTVA